MLIELKKMAQQMWIKGFFQTQQAVRRPLLVVFIIGIAAVVSVGLWLRTQLTMDIAKLGIEYLRVLAWPLIVVFVIIRFKPGIEGLLNKITERLGSPETVVKAGAPGFSLEISGPAVGSVATPSPLSLPRSQVTRVSYRVAITNESHGVVSDEQVQSAVSALKKQVSNDFAPAWGIDAEITFVSGGSRPSADAWWIYILDDSDVAGYISYHTLTPAGLPLVKIFAKTAHDSGYQWTVSASHELLEMLANPRTNLSVFAEADKKTGTLYAYEICDPCYLEELGYDIDGIRVSDFVFPAWFESFRQPESTQFDYRRHITSPLQVAPGCSVNVVEVTAATGWHRVFANKERETTGRRRRVQQGSGRMRGR